MGRMAEPKPTESLYGEKQGGARVRFMGGQSIR